MDNTGVGKEPSANQQVGFEEQAHKASALWCPPLPDDLTGVAMKRGGAAVESHENKFGDIHKRYATRLGVLPFLGCLAGPAKLNESPRESRNFMVRGIPIPFSATAFGSSEPPCHPTMAALIDPTSPNKQPDRPQHELPPPIGNLTGRFWSHASATRQHGHHLGRDVSSGLRRLGGSTHTRRRRRQCHLREGN